MGGVRDAHEQHPLGLRINPTDTLRLNRNRGKAGTGRTGKWRRVMPTQGKVHDLEWSRSSSAVQMYGEGRGEIPSGMLHEER